MERKTGTCLRGKSHEKKTISLSLTVQFTVKTSPCFNTLPETVRSTSNTLGTETQTGERETGGRGQQTVEVLRLFR